MRIFCSTCYRHNGSVLNRRSHDKVISLSWHAFTPATPEDIARLNELLVTEWARLNA